MNKQRSPIIKMALTAWCAVSALLALSSLALYLIRGATVFSIFVTDPPISNPIVVFASTLIVWMLGGAFLFLLHFRVIRADNALTWAGFFLIAFMYVNVLRERIRFGDLEYYVDAALALSRGEALPITYVYPPLWASLLALFAPFKQDGIFLFAWILNVTALFGMYFLVIKSLQIYGFNSNLAVLVTTGFMLINVPLLRTMVYGQVNLIVLDGILLALVYYRRAPFLSALAMTVAVQIKISPIILVFAILLERDWRWLAWFAVNMLVVGSLPIMTHGLAPYNDMIHNLRLMSNHSSFIFRDNSFDSFFLATFSFLKIDLIFARIMIYASKLTLGLLVLRIAFSNARALTFSKESGGKYLYNMAPVLMLLMTMLSPLVWEHHGVFLVLSFLILLKTLSSETDWFLFIIAYFLEFAMPSFDFYPWSYIRLLAPLMVLWLLWKASNVQEPSKFFTASNAWAQSLLPSKP